MNNYNITIKSIKTPIKNIIKIVKCKVGSKSDKILKRSKRRARGKYYQYLHGDGYRIVFNLLV